eukprot:5798884-Prorocentrum_lima.AAC.1
MFCDGTPFAEGYLTNERLQIWLTPSLVLSNGTAVDMRMFQTELAGLFSNVLEAQAYPYAIDLI